MGWTVSKEQRQINFDGTTRPRRFPSNKLNNQKYSCLTFLPLLLYNEFKFFFNMFFLLVALTQFIPFLKVGLLVTYVAPLGIVLLITCGKEAYDDLQRRRRDQELNNYIYHRAAKENEKGKRTREGLLPVKAKDIRVGMIIRVNHNERLPADMVLLSTTEKSGSIFLRTDQLDGETDWKPRKAIPWTQKSATPPDMLASGGQIVCEPPSEQIYDFKAYCVGPGDVYKKEALGPDNTMWQNTVLASQGYVYGMVVYTGRETRSNMSSKKPRSKVGSIDLQINYLSKILFTLMILLSFVIIAIDGFRPAWEFKFFRCVLLLCAIIPISMRINMDFAKLYYSFKISSDKNIAEAVARNSTIPEELGRIQVLLSDKTGTLTKNDMLFKRLTLEYCSFSEENIKDIGKLLRKGMRQLNKDRQKDERSRADGNYTSANEGNTSAAETHFINPEGERFGSSQIASGNA
jgi:phospholipid-translocating ATPase